MSQSSVKQVFVESFTYLGSIIRCRVLRQQWARNHPTCHLSSWGNVCVWSEYLAIQHHTMVWCWIAYAFTIRVFCRYFCMVWRLGRWPCLYPRRSTHRMYGASSASWMYIGQILLPMMRFVLVLNNHCSPVRHQSLPPSFLFWYLSCSDPRQDNHRALQACILGPPGDWRPRIGRPRQS